MALVPFRVSGPAADQQAELRLFQVGSFTIRIQQLPRQSGSMPAVSVVGSCALQQRHPPGKCAAEDALTCAPSPPTQPQQLRSGADRAEQGPVAVPRALPPLESLSHVGLVVWQSGFVLAEYLLRTCPLGRWVGCSAVDLGTGTGLVGIALALAGARVVLTDLPHVLPLAAENVEANCAMAAFTPAVVPYAWGEPRPAAACADARAGGAGSAAARCALLAAGQEYDVLTAADVLYHDDLFEPLMRAIVELSAPHTLTYVAYKVRHGRELAFLGVVEHAGFAAEAVPLEHLHEEYREGQYGILRLCRRDAAPVPMHE